MKITTVVKKIAITCENETEQRQFDSFCDEARKMLPQIKKLWKSDITEISSMNEFRELLDIKGNLSWRITDFLKSDDAMLVSVRSHVRKGGSITKPTIKIFLKLLTGCPHQLVLDEEKNQLQEKYTKEYSKEARHRLSEYELERVKIRASRTANMRLNRAVSSIKRFLEKNPDFALPYFTLLLVVGEEIKKSGIIEEN